MLQQCVYTRNSMYCKWEKEVIGILSSFFWNTGKTQNICVHVNGVVHFPWHRFAQAGDTVSCRLAALRDRTKTVSVVVRFPELQRFMSWLLIYWTCSSVCHNGTQPEIAYLLLTGHCAAFHSLWSSRGLGHESFQLTSPTLMRRLQKAASVSSAGRAPTPNGGLLLLTDFISRGSLHLCPLQQG